MDTMVISGPELYGWRLCGAKYPQQTNDNRSSRRNCFAARLSGWLRWPMRRNQTQAF